MWMCRLFHKTFSSANLAAVSTEKTKLQSFVTKLQSSGQFTREKELIPYEELLHFDVASYLKHYSAVTTGLLSSSFGQTLLIVDKIPTTMKLLEE